MRAASFALLLAIAAGCGRDAEPASSVIELDGGRRWLLDDHARAVFARVQDAAAVPRPDASARRALGAELQDLVRELIEGCTMSGPAHDRLHEFLSVYIPAVDALATTGDADDVDRVRELIALHARTFE